MTVETLLHEVTERYLVTITFQTLRKRKIPTWASSEVCNLGKGSSVVNYLPHHHKDLSSNPQHPCEGGKKTDIDIHSFNPGQGS